MEKGELWWYFLEEEKGVSLVGRGIQWAAQCRNNQFLNKLEAKLLQEYNSILRQEEVFWVHKSWTNWLRFGDKNTIYFHTTTFIKHKHNKVESLKNNEGQWIVEGLVLKTMVMEFFSDLFTDNNPNMGMYHTQCQFNSFIDEQKSMLSTTVSYEDVRTALFEVGSFKALVPDEFPPFSCRINGT